MTLEMALKIVKMDDEETAAERLVELYDTIKELDKKAKMWADLKEIVQNKFTTSGSLDTIMKEIEKNNE